MSEKKEYANKRAMVQLETNEIYAKYLFPCTARYIFLFGSAGSGKSVAASQDKSIQINTQLNTKHKILCARKTYNTIQESMYSRIVNELDSTGMSTRFNPTKSPLKIRKKPPRGKPAHQQSSFIFIGVSDEDKMKSLEGITSIWIEEATELKETEFLQLDIRMRGETKGYHQLIASFNPVSEDHWIAKYAEPQMFNKEDRLDGITEIRILLEGKVWEYDREVEIEIDGKLQVVKSTTRIINSTWEDNRFLDIGYKATLAGLAASDDLMSQVYYRGRWGQLNKDGLFFPTFARGRHVRPISKMQYDPDLPIHLSIDFNVKPYMSGLLMQVVEKTGNWEGFDEWVELRIIDEICSKSPFNTGQGLAKAFVGRYPVNSGFFLYGDATGRSQSGIEGMKGVKSLFDDFRLGLGAYKSYMIERVPTVNPRYKAIAKDSLGRHAFMIRMFNGKSMPVRVLVSDKCKNTILDLSQCTVDSNGKMEKKKDKDGVEQRGHLADCFMYATCHPKLFGRFARIDFKF